MLLACAPTGMRRAARWLAVTASLVGGAVGAGGQTPPPELTLLGKRLLESGVTGEKAQSEARARLSASLAAVFAEWDIGFPHPMCAFPGGLCGAVNRDGSIAVAPQFDWVDKFHEERALVRLRGLYGFVDTTGRIIVEPQYELASRFKGGYAQFVVGDKMGLIDREGQIVVEPRFGYVDAFGADTFWASAEQSLCEHIRRKGSGTFISSFCARGSRLIIDGNPSFALVPKGKVVILDRQGRRLNGADLLAFGSFAASFGFSNFRQQQSGDRSGQDRDRLGRYSLGRHVGN